MAWLWRGRWEPASPAFALRFALTLVLGLLLSPHLNPHDDLLLVPAGAVAYGAVREKTEGRWFGVALFAAPFIVLVTNPLSVTEPGGPLVRTPVLLMSRSRSSWPGCSLGPTVSRRSGTWSSSPEVRVPGPADQSRGLGGPGRCVLVRAVVDQLPVGKEPEPPGQQEGDQVEAADQEEQRPKAGHERHVLEHPPTIAPSRLIANDMSAGVGVAERVGEDEVGEEDRGEGDRPARGRSAARAGR